VKKFVLELYHRKKNWVIGIGLLLFLNIISFAGIAFFNDLHSNTKGRWRRNGKKTWTL